MLRLAIVTMFILSLWAIVSSVDTMKPVFACSCAGGVTIEEQVTGADAIFVGHIVAIFPTSLNSKSAVFSVDSSWKGINEKIVVVSTASSGTACGADFEMGHEYLIYASDNNSGLRTSSCGGVQPVSSAANVMQVLGNDQTPIVYPIKIDVLSVQLIGIGAAIAGIIAFIALRKRK